MSRSEQGGAVCYVVKVYPRFSETFIVTEVLAREAQGERIAIAALRPTDDARFHPELARVQAPVHHLPRPQRPAALWELLRGADEALAAAIARELPALLAADVDDAAQAVALAALVRREGYAHLHAHFASSATAVARLAARLAGVPYSCTAHAKDIFHESVRLDDLRERMGEAAYVATVSEYNVRHLRALLPEHASRIHLVRNGIELARFPYRPPAPRVGPLRVLAVGRLVEKKGFDVLLRALAAARARGVDATLDLAGDGELAGELARLVTALGLEGAVRLLGPVPQDRVAELLERADLFAAPCVVGADGNADGLPTVLLEAMATGVPCVATAVTGIPEVVVDGRTGILLEPGDVDALADAIARVAHGAVDVAALAAEARALVERLHDAPRAAAAHRALMPVLEGSR